MIEGIPGARSEPELMVPLGNATFEYEFQNLAPAAYKFTVDSAVSHIAVDAVTDWSLVSEKNIEGTIGA